MKYNIFLIIHDLMQNNLRKFVINYESGGRFGGKLSSEAETPVSGAGRIRTG